MNTDDDVQALIEALGWRIARDLAEQAVRTPHDAARAAGCGNDQEVADWLARHRPQPPAGSPPAAA